MRRKINLSISVPLEGALLKKQINYSQIFIKNIILNL